MFLRKKNKKKKERKETDDKLLIIKEQLFKRISQIQEQVIEEKIQDGFINLFHTIREFFAIIFKIKYEFTYEELIKEIEKKKNIPPELKKKIGEFFQEVSFIEYSDKTLSKELLNSTILDFRHIVILITKKEKEKDRKKGIKKENQRKVFSEKLYKLKQNTLNVLHTLKLYKTEAEKKDIERKKKLIKKQKEAKTKPVETITPNIKQIDILINKANIFLKKKNIDMAKKTYVLLNRIYQNSNADEKEKKYDAVKEIYHKIVAYTSSNYKDEVKKSLSNIKIDEQKINNLIANIHTLVRIKDMKKAKILYAVGCKLYTMLPARERKKVYLKLREVHDILNRY